MLLNAHTVRLYQVSLFHERTGDGWTPWHSDARTAPFDTSKMITFWIPLRRVPSPEEGGTGLLFANRRQCNEQDTVITLREGGDPAATVVSLSLGSKRVLRVAKRSFRKVRQEGVPRNGVRDRDNLDKKRRDGHNGFGYGRRAGGGCCR